MIKEIIEKYKVHYGKLLNLEKAECNALQILEDIIFDLEKINELQEKVINSLIKMCVVWSKKYEFI